MYSAELARDFAPANIIQAVSGHIGFRVYKGLGFPKLEFSSLDNPATPLVFLSGRLILHSHLVSFKTAGI